MEAATATPAPEELDELSAGELLSAVRDTRRAEDRAAARALLLAHQWAVLHPALEESDAATFAARGSDGALYAPIAGPGCPAVAEFAIPEFGAVLGISTDAAKRVIGHSLELRHRLPRLWALVQEGSLPAWRARRVAEATIHASTALTLEAADWVDRQVAAVAGKVGVAQVDRIVAEAIARFHLVTGDSGADDLDHAPDPRHVTIDRDSRHFTPTVRIEAELDLDDALDLDHALQLGAAELKHLGSTDSLDARRAQALGHVARRQLALDLTSSSDDTVPSHSTPDERPAEPGSRDRSVARRLDLVIHLTADPQADPTGATVFQLRPTALLDKGQRLLLLDQVKDWCAASHTEVRVLPVIDLDDELTTTGYVPGPRLRRQVQLRDRTCVFPWCSRPAHTGDLDHTVPHDSGGATASSNLGALCRRHHRLKTHSNWQVTQPVSGTFLWTSPHGHRFRRDGSGTTALGDDPPAGRSSPIPHPRAPVD